MDHMAQPFVFEKLAKQMTHVGKAAPTIERYVAVYAEKTASILPQSRIQEEMVELVQAVRFKNQRQTRSVAKKKKNGPTEVLTVSYLASRRGQIHKVTFVTVTMKMAVISAIE